MGNVFDSAKGVGKRFETRVVQSGARFDKATGALSVPIYQSATFAHPSLGVSTGYDYTRTLNPTRQACEEVLADLEGGYSAYCFSSGLAAITAILMIFKTGDHIVLGEDLYGGTYRLLDKIFDNFGMMATYVDTTDLNAVEGAITKDTKALFFETPSNPMLQMSDVPALASICKKHNILSIVDNTLLTPYLQRPIELGCDLVVHSATKYLGGHNDVLAGVVIGSDEEVSKRIAFVQNATGAVLSPNECWLLLRGLKTLSVRLDRQVANAALLSEWLREREQVEKVFYPGTGAMISFKLKSVNIAAQILKKVKVMSFAESLGGVETLITYPLVQTHADVPQITRERLGIDDRLLRISVGIENIDDLCYDLEQAMTEV